MEKNIDHNISTDGDLGLAAVLAECQQVSIKGRRFADDAIKILKSVITSASDELRDIILALERSNIEDRDTERELAIQLSSIKSNFEMLPYQLAENVNSIPDESFSITLFGRTMAGKSTLMEILIRGDGQSIGKGKQRTTLDVRTYTYKGLSVTDVPGVAAFGEEGRDDENIAFTAAQKSDLILFLITDDAPQADEAECLNSILCLGKPVICIINVKVNISTAADMPLFKRDIQKKFKPEHLEGLRKALYAYGEYYGQNWWNLRIGCVHLRAAYFSQQNEWKSLSDEIYKLSRFQYVEELIVGEVKKYGQFYKLKSFSDVVAVPMTDAVDTLFSQSAQNSEHGSILIKKRSKLREWTSAFEVDSNKRIEAMLHIFSGELRGEVAAFAEDFHDKSHATNEWKKIMNSHKIESRTKELMDALGRECEEELQEICREINAEIKFSNAAFKNKSLNTNRIIDGKRIWNWAIALTSGGLTTYIPGMFNEEALPPTPCRFSPVCP